MTSNKSVWEPINEDDTLKTTKIDGERWALVEIVSALRVPKAAAADCGTKSGASNPYVIVTVAGKEMHRTDVCYSDPNPVWTIKTGSLFLLELNKDDDGGGDKKKVDPTTATVTFTINDCDATTEHQTVGTVKINLKDLMYVLFRFAPCPRLYRAVSTVEADCFCFLVFPVQQRKRKTKGILREYSGRN